MPSASSCKRVAVIMAGGSGERFWPLSRNNHPKQLLCLTSPTETMLDEAVARIIPLVPAEDVYVQTSLHLRQAIQDAGLSISGDNVLAEPCKRNTSGCLAYAAACLMAKYGGGGVLTMAVLTSDHEIGTPDRFRETIKAAMDEAERNDTLVCIGIPPTRAATGYGYIQAEATMESSQGPAVAGVKAFHEKPDLETAKEYLDDGHYFWNSGMFFWRISTFLSELDGACPKLASATREMAEAFRAGNQPKVQAIFEALDNVSIDYALMEKARNVRVVRATFPWDDIGSWAALERSRETDSQGNVVHGSPVVIDTSDSIIYDTSSPGKIAVSVIGVKGLVVVVTDDGIMVVPKDRAEEVRKAVEELKRRGASQT